MPADLPAGSDHSDRLAQRHDLDDTSAPLLTLSLSPPAAVTAERSAVSLPLPLPVASWGPGGWGGPGAASRSGNGSGSVTAKGGATTVEAAVSVEAVGSAAAVATVLARRRWWR